MQAFKHIISRIPSSWLLTLTGGFICVAVFYARYYFIPTGLYISRDDGIITLSHAKNWIEYGFIGVNPSGERVEGFSAPLQFFLFSALYTLTGLSYENYMPLQTLACTFMLGALFIRFFETRWPQRILCTALGSIIMAAHSSFILWHGSGMENALTHVLFLATLYVLYHSAKTATLDIRLVWVPMLAMLCRLDSPLHIAPLVACFAAYWQWRFQSYRGWGCAALTFAAWGIFTLWRYIYFGSWTPNTALAQSINTFQRLQRWDSTLTNPQLGRIAWRHGIYILAVCLPLWVYLPKTQSPALKCIFAALCLGISLFAIHWLLFGGARLDGPRTTTHITLYIALLAALLTAEIRQKKQALLYAPLLIIGIGFAVHLNVSKLYTLCCSADGFFARIRTKIEHNAAQQNLPRPLVANPDLGALSWQKKYNVVDLGKLGSPILARLRSNQAKANYFFEFMAPDIIESHSVWSCMHYKALFADSRFNLLYTPIQERIIPGGCKNNPQFVGMWIRKDILAESNSKERNLIDKMAGDASILYLQEEMKNCQAEKRGSCAYIVRTAYRFLPELKAQRALPRLIELFEQSPLPHFGYYLINGSEDTNALAPALQEIKQYGNNGKIED